MNEPSGANGTGCSTALNEVWEIPILLSGCSFRELVDAACRRGLTTAELLRCLITTFLNCEKGRY